MVNLAKVQDTPCPKQHDLVKSTKHLRGWLVDSAKHCPLRSRCQALTKPLMLLVLIGRRIREQQRTLSMNTRLVAPWLSRPDVGSSCQKGERNRIGLYFRTPGAHSKKQKAAQVRTRKRREGDETSSSAMATRLSSPPEMPLLAAPPILESAMCSRPSSLIT